MYLATYQLIFLLLLLLSLSPNSSGVTSWMARGAGEVVAWASVVASSVTRGELEAEGGEPRDPGRREGRQAPRSRGTVDCVISQDTPGPGNYQGQFLLSYHCSYSLVLFFICVLIYFVLF